VNKEEIMAEEMSTNQGQNISDAGQQQGRDAARDRSGGAQAEGALLPPVDVVEDAGGITLYADLPGVSRESLSLHLETDSLTIEGTVALDEPQDMQSNHAEVTVPRYRRVFTLSKELDGEKATAELKNGVLTLRIPKAQHAQPRRLEVKVA
jgi:HSP20 family molecular chaperone IbpA